MWDLVALAGIGSIGWGVWQISQPFAWITIGSLVVGVALLGGYRRARVDRKKDV